MQNDPRRGNPILASENKDEPCRDCTGPSEFWGFSGEYRILRCIPCQVVRFVKKDVPPERPPLRLVS